MFCYVDYTCKLYADGKCPLKDSNKKVLSCSAYTPILREKEFNPQSITRDEKFMEESDV